jgi:UDP:flavonoid glycosyltransferase YjiC (YdhE family)
MLMTGWGGLRTEATAQEIFVAESVPHSWLFPRMAAVVHHGGAGTTAEGLRAGVPTVITPFVLDQPFWGARVTALGLGPKPIPQKRLTADRLARAVDEAVLEPAMQSRAREIGAAIRNEDGIGNAIAIVERYLGAARAQTPESEQA